MLKNTEGRFMVAVGAIVEHAPTGLVLLVRRVHDAEISAGMWEHITGRMKQFEEPETALKREVREETGLLVDVVKPISVFHIFRGARVPENELVGIVYWCRSASDEVLLSEEHSEFRWLPGGEALELVGEDGIREDIRSFLRARNRQ